MILTEFGETLDADGDYAQLAAELRARKYPGEFLLVARLDPDEVEAAALAGFMPMSAKLRPEGNGITVFTPKLHRVRCIASPAGLRPTKTSRRQSGLYRISMNLAFDPVLAGCVETHGDDWLTPELADCFRTLAAERQGRAVKFVSAELWNGNELVAGEIGYLIGSSYASLSGFTKRSGAGTVQLYALAALMAHHGVACWDLGMPLEYKNSLGAKSFPREEYLEMLGTAYGKPVAEALTLPLEALEARDLLAAARTAASACADLTTGA